MHRLLIALIFVATASVAQAADIRFGSNWKEQRFSLFSSNAYGFGGSTLSVKSDDSVSLVYTQLDEAQWGASTAAWNWNVQTGVPATNLSKKGGDDRNLALYAIFLPKDAAQRLKGKSVRRLLNSKEVRVLVYVWGGDARRGSVLGSPYLGARGKTIVLRPSGSGKFSERVNLADDYKRAFGGNMEAIVGLAISADSDDTDSRISASISSLRVD